MPGTNGENYESVLLKQQMALFRVLDHNIKVSLSSDGHTLTASNISELAINDSKSQGTSTIYCEPNKAGLKNGWTVQMCSQPSS
jgi:hypothetical protein